MYGIKFYFSTKKWALRSKFFLGNNSELEYKLCSKSKKFFFVLWTPYDFTEKSGHFFGKIVRGTLMSKTAPCVYFAVCKLFFKNIFIIQIGLLNYRYSSS